MSDHDYQRARFSEGFDFIIDSEGNRVQLDDPRVVHVWPFYTGANVSRMIESAFGQFNWNFRFVGKTTPQGLELGRRVFSGRECYPCISIAGETLVDLEENRGDDEVTIYYGVDIQGACQSAAWPIVWETIISRTNPSNAVFNVTPQIHNNYFGKGMKFALAIVVAALVGDLLEEAETTLTCLAKDKDSALVTFTSESAKVIESARRGTVAVSSALSQWADRVAQIPLQRRVAQVPRILIFGGLGTMFLHHQVGDYMLEHGVIPKVEETTGFLSLVLGRQVLRYGLKRGLTEPQDQYRTPSIVASLLNPENQLAEGIKALRSRASLVGVDLLQRYFRKVARRSGLLYYEPIPTQDVIKKGNQYSSYSCDVETPLNLGLYACTIENRDIDGLVNICYFSCPPCMNAQTIIKSLASTSDIPFAAIDCDTPEISMNQRRLLESVAIQARRIRAERAGA